MTVICVVYRGWIMPAEPGYMAPEFEDGGMRMMCTRHFSVTFSTAADNDD